MKIDFAIIHNDKNESEIKDILNKIILNPSIVTSITCPFFYIKSCKTIVKNTIPISCLIDYPLGIADLKTRLFAVQQAHKAGVSYIDICMPQNLASNRRYEKIRDDVKNINDYCQSVNIIPRYILEYRVFNHNCLKKICEIFDTNNISNVFTSSMYFLDDLSDNLIASVFLYENSKNLNIYTTGNMWTKKHFDLAYKTGLYGARVSSAQSLDILGAILSEKRDKLK
jgi:deoxyribose-phosphate aldolase